MVGGSLADGVEVRLAEGASVESIPVGSYVVIQGESRRFFGMVSEVRLASTDTHIRSAPGGFSDPFVAQALTGTAAYGTIVVRPRLVLPTVAGGPGDNAPARTVPAHFSRASRASEADVAQVFGEEGGDHFAVGTPLDMEAVVCLDLKTLLQRSNGVFGKSGTGKSFLTRLLLIGVLQSRLSALLIFDMHNEYGWEGGDVERGRRVKSLKQLFPSEVSVFALDERRARGAKVQPDFRVEIGYGEITPDDVMALRETLGISDAAAEAAFALGRKFGDGRWLREFLRLEGTDELGELATSINVNGAALATLHRRLTNRIVRLPFVTDAPGADAVAAIMDHLDRGQHVVLEFGRYGDDVLAYMLVANLLTRRIHDRYRERQSSDRGGALDHAADHRHRGGAPVPEPGGRVAVAVRHHRAGDAQEQRDAAGGGPAAERHRPGGAEPGGHQGVLPAGRRARRGRRHGGRVGQPRAALGACGAALPAAGALLRRGGADSRRGAGARLRHGHELRRADAASASTGRGCARRDSPLERDCVGG